MMAKHPFDAPPSLPDDLVRAMFDITVQGSVQCQQNVHQATEYWQRRAAKLAVQEQVLHKHMPLHRRKVLLGKKLLLFKEMMESVHHRDKELPSDVAAGFTITGDMPSTGVFKIRPEEKVDQENGCGDRLLISEKRLRHLRVRKSQRTTSASKSWR